VTDYSATRFEDDDDGRRTPMARRAAWWLIGGIAVLLATIVLFGRLRQPSGEPGALTKTLYPLPSDVPATLLNDGTSIWGLSSWSSTSRSHFSGGVSLGDLDGMASTTS